MLHFLQQLWNLGEFNQRVSWAKTFEYVFSDKMREDALEQLPYPQWYGGSSQNQPAAFYELNQNVDYYHALFGNGFP